MSRILETVRDSVNSSKQVEEACRSMAHLPFPVCASRYSDGQMLFLNKEAKELLGLSDREVQLEKSGLFRVNSSTRSVARY